MEPLKAINMGKKLKFWNGRGVSGRGFIYVAAYSRAEATRMINSAFKTIIAQNEVKDYYSEGGWGNRLRNLEIETNCPCIYFVESCINGGKIIKKDFNID